MNTLLEYAFIASLFIVFASLAAIGFLVYNKRFSAEARMLRQRLGQIEAQRRADKLAHAGAERKDDLGGPIAEIFEKIILMSGIKNLIASAAVKAKPHEIVVISVVLACVGFLMSFFSPKGALGWILALALPLGLAYSPIAVLKYLAKRRCRKFEDKFPEALGLMARALQAGSGLTSALGMAASELPDPCGTEFKKAFDEINFGISFNDAITNMASRVNSQDLNFFVAALVIQRETGGNLAELLIGLGHTIRERQKLTRKVQIISAEGRLSGNVLIALPFLMVGILTLINPDYLDLLWSTEAGQTSVSFGMGMMAIGAFLIRRIVAIKA